MSPTDYVAVFHEMRLSEALVYSLARYIQSESDRVKEDTRRRMRGHV